MSDEIKSGKALAHLIDNARPILGPSRAGLQQAYDAGRLAGVREAVEACWKVSRTNREAAPQTAYSEGRADGGEACAAAILALAKP